LMETPGSVRTLRDLQKKKRRGERIVALTAYDFQMARLEESAGVDFILVGDSIGMAVLGDDTTLGVTMEIMLPHAAAVSRGAPATLVIGDMPFGSYEISDEQAVGNAVRFLAEGGTGAVKLEGGNARSVSRVRAIVDSGIPVMGHIGLQPQSIRKTGGYRVIYSDQRDRMISEALALQDAGAFAIVIESMEEELAAEITRLLAVPTIGIGAGRLTDGQILVVNDMLGLSGGFSPRFLKKYAALDTLILEAIRSFASDVTGGSYPGTEHVYPAKEDR
jgi:3-methyl-2-oxobutanoate hydroxymethyltransferase